MGYQFNSRKALSEYIQKEPSVMGKKRYNTVLRVVHEESEGFVMEIMQEFRKVFARTGAFIDVVYVYGGGATPLRDVLYGKLIEESLDTDRQPDYPVMYLDSRYSRYLNEEGLFLVAQRLAAAGQ